MRKISKVAFALVCILAISSIGLANAGKSPHAPNTTKTVGQCSLVYWTSEDSTLYDVTKRNTFILPLDGNIGTWYYLDIKSIKPDISVDPQYSCELFPFILDQNSVADNEAFWDYWDAKLAVPLANSEPWAYLMEDILHGEQPMFMLKATPTGQYMLVDFLQFMVDNMGGSSEIVYSPLKINGDYPLGTYTFVGHTDLINKAAGIYPDSSILDSAQLENPLADVSMTITFR